jgi:hypothetical protein
VGSGAGCRTRPAYGDPEAHAARPEVVGHHSSSDPIPEVWHETGRAEQLDHSGLLEVQDERFVVGLDRVVTQQKRDHAIGAGRTALHRTIVAGDREAALG